MNLFNIFSIMLLVLIGLLLFTPTKNCQAKFINSVLIQVIFGFEHKTPHGIAHHWVLMIGFLLEATILYSSASKMLASTMIDQVLIFLIIFNLILHQILIYRNFTVADHHSHVQSHNIASKLLSIVTFFIFIGIGAVAGEFGYLFAVSKLSHIGENGSFISQLIDIMQATPEKIAVRFEYEKPIEGHEEVLILKYSLKSLFVAGATVVCLLVLVWDVLVKLIPEEYSKFKGVWKFFVGMDILSFAIWIVISTFIVPSSDYFTTQEARDYLLIVVALYSIATLWRMYNGYSALKTYDDHTSKLAL